MRGANRSFRLSTPCRSASKLHRRGGTIRPRVVRHKFEFHMTGLWRVRRIRTVESSVHDTWVCFDRLQGHAELHGHSVADGQRRRKSRYCPGVGLIKKSSPYAISDGRVRRWIRSLGTKSYPAWAYISQSR